MGHSGSGIFQAYINELVDTDTQSVFLGTPTKDALIKLSTNSSITRDPSAPRRLTHAQRRSVERDPELMALERDRVEFRDSLIAEYGMLSKIKDMTILQEYRKRSNKVRTRRNRLLKKKEAEVYSGHFDNVGDTIIEMNYRGESCTYRPDTSSIPPERKTLAALEFQNRDVDTVPYDELVEDRNRSLELRLALSRLNTPRRLVSNLRLEYLANDIPFPDKSSDWSPTGLECPECLNNHRLHPQAQRFSYCNKYVLRDHLQTVHLERMDFSKLMLCSYPNCGKFLVSVTQYLHHVARVHEVQLPKR